MIIYICFYEGDIFYNDDLVFLNILVIDGIYFSVIYFFFRIFLGFLSFFYVNFVFRNKIYIFWFRLFN